MNNDDRVNESLSALADGECDELESARVLKTLRASAELRKRWECMHMARAVIRGERADLISRNFADNLSRAIDNEAHMLVPERPSRSVTAARNWRKPLAGLAIAASVAMVSVVGLRTLQPDGAQTQIADYSPAVTQPRAVRAAAIGGTRWNVQRAEVAQRLNNYLLNHMEYATMGEMQGMLPYSRLAGYDQLPTQ